MEFDFPTEIVVEGDVRVLVPKLEAYKTKAWEYAPSKAPVFYNPAMEMNRDIAVLALQAYGRKVPHGLVVSEPLAGCGVRGVRFAVEVDNVEKVAMNDINPLAVRMIEYNIRLNGVEGKASAENKDANLFLSQYAAPRVRFDYIDVDPFGSPVPYLDSAVRALRNGGLIALTATDMAPLCGVHPNASLRKYGGKPLRTEYCHEIAVRLLIGSLVLAAAKHEMGVKPALAYAVNHYCRLYAFIRHGARRADESIRRMGYILHCFNCLHRETHMGMVPRLEWKCPSCGSVMEAAGPLWLGELSDEGFCESTVREAESRELKESKRIMRLLSLIKGESGGPATYYTVDKICDKHNLRIPPLKSVITKIREKGFKAAPTHFNSRGIRTDAPSRVVKEAVEESL